jgi:hypothetical protein
MQQGRIVAASLTGDFFFYPAGELAALEQTLAGMEPADVLPTIWAFYQAHDIESPGVAPEDLAAALGVV